MDLLGQLFLVPSVGLLVCRGQRHRRTASIHGTAKRAPFAMGAAWNMESGVASVMAQDGCRSNFCV